MEELQRGLETAGIGIGLVFAALVSLAVLTTLLARAFRGHAAPDGGQPLASPPAAAPGTPSPASGVDGALVAAMTAAVQFVRRGRTGSRTTAAGQAAAAEPGRAWRTLGRGALMASQGVRVRPRGPRP